MMRVLRIALLLSLAMALAGCPVKDPDTGKVDPYATAQQYIDYAKLMPPKAEALYGEVVFWLKLDGEKKKEADAVFNKTLGNLKKAIDLAQASLDAARANKEKVGVDRVIGWLSSADSIWKELRQLIQGMLPSSVGGIQPQSVTDTKARAPEMTLPESLIKK